MPIAKKQSCTDQGYELKDSQCRKVARTDLVTSYTCDQGTKSGKKCIIVDGGEKTLATVRISYHCPKSFESEGKGKVMTCHKKGSAKVPLQKSYTCEGGWKQRLKGKKVDCVLLRAS
jgi:hypothetical protein